MILDECTKILEGCSQSKRHRVRGTSRTILIHVIRRLRRKGRGESHGLGHVFYIIWGILPLFLTPLIRLPFVCGKEHSVSYFLLPLYTGKANEKLILRL